MNKIYSITESEKVRNLAEVILIDIQKHLKNFLDKSNLKDLEKLNNCINELKALNIELVNPVIGQIKIPTIINGEKKDQIWSLMNCKKR